MSKRRRRRKLAIFLLLPGMGLLFWVTAFLTSQVPGRLVVAVNVHALNPTGEGDGHALRPAPLSLSLLADASQDTQATPRPSATTPATATHRPTPVATASTTPSARPSVAPTPSPTPTLPVPTPTPTPGAGTISGQVLDSATKNPIVGATVTVNPGGASALTGATGNFSFSVAPGSYVVNASAPTYNGASQNVSVSGGQHVVLTFKLVSITAYGSIAGTVLDAVTDAPIAGAIVRLSNGLVRATDTNGDFSYSVVLNGTYTLTVSALGYATSSQPVTVKSGHTTNVRVLLSQ
jgi:PEGA domain.